VFFCQLQIAIAMTFYYLGAIYMILDTRDTQSTLISSYENGSKYEIVTPETYSYLFEGLGIRE
jgi:hypothetical protein